MDAAKKESRSLLSNTVALFSIQVANYILPFLLIPYLTRVLGVELYGIVSFGLAIVHIGCIVTDYGFNLSATYQIAKNRTDKAYINRIISAVFTSKLVLLFIVALFIFAYASIQEKYQEYQSFFCLMLLPVIGQTFQPIWFFQGIQNMIVITLYTLSAKTLYVVIVFLLVKNQDDLTLVAYANGIGQITAAVIGIVMIWRLGYRFLWPGWNLVKITFFQSTSFFLSRAALASYTAGSVFFLGCFASPIQVAYYSAAEQLYRGGRALLDSGSQALYPYMISSRNFKLFFKVLIFAIGVSLSGLVVGTFGGELIIEFIFGSGFIQSYPVLIVFLIILVVATPSVLFGFPFLGAVDKINLANRSVIYGGIVQTLMLFTCYAFGLYSSVELAYTVLISEAFILLIRLTYVVKHYRK